MQKQQLDSCKLDYVTKDSAAAKKCIYMLHGYGADNNDLAPLADTIATSSSYDWYFPNGPEKIIFNGMPIGRAWFPLDMEFYQKISSPQEIDNYFMENRPPLLSATLEKLLHDLAVLENNYDEIVLGGFSQGAMMVSHLLLAKQGIETYKKALLFSGALIDSKSFTSAQAKESKFLQIKTFHSHGKQDATLPIQTGESLFKMFEGLSFQAEFHAFDGGHEIPYAIFNLLPQFLT